MLLAILLELLYTVNTELKSWATQQHTYFPCFCHTHALLSNQQKINNLNDTSESYKYNSIKNALSFWRGTQVAYTKYFPLLELQLSLISRSTPIILSPWACLCYTECGSIESRWGLRLAMFTQCSSFQYPETPVNILGTHLSVWTAMVRVYK